MGMSFGFVVYASWIVLFVVWVRGYFTSKRSSDVPSPGRQVAATVLLIACFVLLFTPHMPGLGRPVTPQAPGFGWTGAVLTFAGIAVAIWARLTLGRDWSGLVMSVKERHRLVQDGPYAIVRHPIYTGLLLAIIGTALTFGTAASYLGLVAGFAGFMIRIDIEERLMREQFGAIHEAYRQRTRKLIPFVW